VRLLEECIYEPSVSRCLEQLLKPGAVFLDVGLKQATRDIGHLALIQERLTLAKVDVEGFKVEVVRCAAHLMRQRKIERWLIETHPAQWSRPFRGAA
jgi:hypothetical protein